MTHDAQRGASLVELIVSIVIISIGLTGIILAINRTAGGSGDPMAQHQSIAVAEAYLDEILSKDFVDPGGGAETRPTFDDVSDYNGLVNNGCTAVTPTCAGYTCPCDQSGLEITQLRGYVVNVAVTSVALGPAGNPVPAADAWLVQVAVIGPDGLPMRVSGYRTRYQ
ncbi:MAG TPA: prepilin-type N-terminal cleavage/methylation domain-containing protein [Burkholderiales bacterium]|nr:prepilin-type N-terminal cleavage/methylation domain-containing protein [Burkholderiales bacterium]